MKKEKVKIGLTPLNWVLSIAGILLLSCLIILPPVFRVFIKEAKVVEEIPEQIIIEKLTCSRKNYRVGSHVENDLLTFNYYKDKIRTYTRKREMSYQNLDQYELDKQSFGRLTSAYDILEGIKYSVNTDDTETKIVVSESYDLGVFKKTYIIIPGDTEETEVDSKYTLEDSVNAIKNDLEKNGYTCN